MNTQNLVAENISKKYKDVEVLHPTSLEIEPGKIYGLIGRNGAGKTTLLSLLTSQNPVTTGSITYKGENIWENSRALADICFSRELNPMLLLGPNTYRAKDYFNLAKHYYPHWDEAYAARLIQNLGLDVKKRISKMNKGLMSTITIVLAMASRAPITILDEPVAGLDVAMRNRFYRLLLDDYEKTGRTFIVSTHILEEASSIFEEIIFLHEGTLIEKRNTEEYLSQFYFVFGRDDVVETAIKGLDILHTEGIGRQKTVCVKDTAGQLAAQAAGLDVEISKVPLHKAFIYVTGGEKEENLA